jgi:hypothetical protein
MQKTAVLSQSAYDKIRKEAVQVEVYRKEVSLSEFKIVNRKYIELDGITIEMTDHAMKRMLLWFRIPTTFAKRFEEGYGEDGLAQLVEMIKNQHMTKKDRKFTLAVNPNTRQIIDVLPPKYASISNSSFLDFAERYIDQYDLQVTHFGYDQDGSTQLNCLTGGVYNVDGLKKEVFSTGVIFRNDPADGLVVSPYMNRLICTNGITSTAFTEKHAIHTFSYHNVRKFNDHMADLSSIGFRPFGVGEKIKDAMRTNASLNEVRSAFSMMSKSGKGADPAYLQRYIPEMRMNRAYTDLGHNPSEFTKPQMMAANSGMSVWEVVNAMTNFASNDTRVSLTDMDRSNLMIGAGNMLMKKKWDYSNTVPVDPFARRGILSERESKISMGECD